MSIYKKLTMTALISTLLPIMSGSQTTTVMRDPDAISLLSTALQRLGGKDAWKSTHAIRTQGTMTFSGHTATGFSDVTYQFDWLDDWSMKQPRYVRSTTTPKGTHTVSRGARFSLFAALAILDRLGL